MQVTHCCTGGVHNIMHDPVDARISKESQLQMRLLTFFLDFEIKNSLLNFFIFQTILLYTVK